jgi:hypothetical protein
MNTLKKTISILMFLGLTNCNVKSDDVLPSFISSGDIIVSNGGNGSVILLSADGLYKAKLYEINSTAERIWGLAWKNDSSELYLSVDGADRVMAIPTNGVVTERLAIANPNLTGNIRSITQLVGGDLLVIETNNIERFTESGDRVITNGWPISIQTAGSDIHATSNGGFIHCSTGTDRVALYDANGVQLQIASSNIAATTDAMSCIVLKSGKVAVAWSGTTDTVQIFSADLSSVVASYTDATWLRTPTSIDQAANGNILVADSTTNTLIEITEAGAYVRRVGNAFTNAPQVILVVP